MYGKSIAIFSFDIKYYGSQCCAAFHGRTWVCMCDQDAQTYPIGYLANTDSVALYIPYTYLDGGNVTLRVELPDVCTFIDADYIVQMVNKLTTDIFQEPMKQFAELWLDYTTMVSILLSLTRAQRDCSYDLHLYPVKCMLPFFFSYKSRWHIEEYNQQGCNDTCDSRIFA